MSSCLQGSVARDVSQAVGDRVSIFWEEDSQESHLQVIYGDYLVYCLKSRSMQPRDRSRCNSRASRASHLDLQHHRLVGRSLMESRRRVLIKSTPGA